MMLLLVWEGKHLKKRRGSSEKMGTICNRLQSVVIRDGCRGRAPGNVAECVTPVVTGCKVIRGQMVDLTLAPK